MNFPSILLMAGLALGVLSRPREARGQEAQYRTVPAFGNLTFTDPVVITSPPGRSNELYVLEQRGVISVITNLAAPTRTLFMDISARVTTQTSASDERGCLGLAFHPGYITNQIFFVFYTTTGSLFDRLSRFEASADLSQGLPNTEVILINQADNQGNHNGGDLHFGQDGYLYVSLGDEGGSNDNQGNSQRINGDFFSAIMRLDVDPEKRPDSLLPNPHAASLGHYAIPSDNPFVGAATFNGQSVNPQSTRTEFWCVGMRNPWRMSFDPITGWLYCGDVGQGAWEEIDIIVSGANYGWAYLEGAHTGPKSGRPTGFTSVLPIFEYGHGSGTNQGRSVTGGVVYRGSRIDSLSGHYVFADYESDNIWAFLYDGASVSQFRRLTTDADIAAFGVDPSNGDILLADRGDDTIKRLIYEAPSALEVTLVPSGALWKYLDNGSNQGMAWKELGFDDALWKSGPAELGYGDNDEATVIAQGPAGNRYITSYFRHRFDLPDPSAVTDLTVELLRDDGGIVYLNGSEVFRSNMPGDPVTYQTTALTTVGGADEATFLSQSVDPILLLPGDNILAVEIHQQNGGSSDVSFDLALKAELSPQLEISLVGDTALISWAAPAPGYQLISAADPEDIWSAVPEAATTENDRASVRVSLEGQTRYFQLERSP